MSGRFPKFNLTDNQIRGIANIVLHEQGTVAGWFAEASQIANLAEIRYGGDPVKAVCSGWYAKGTSRYKARTNNKTVIDIVKRVFCEGFRTLPRYINEHDCMSDLKSVTENGKNVKGSKKLWKRHTTVIKNRMGATYYFWDFPGGYNTTVDPFGYTSKALSYTVAEAQAGIDPYPDRLLSLLKEYNAYIKEHHKSIINTYDSNMTSFAKAKKAIADGRKVGITCVVPLRWALYEMGLSRSDGKYLISGNDGSFGPHYTGAIKKYFTLITTGAAIGLTVKQAINKKLLMPGDIICYKDHTHTSVYSGESYQFYEGGSQSAKNGYASGVKINYEKYPYEISQILRLKNQPLAVTAPAETKKEEYTMSTIKKGSKGKIVKVWQVILGVTIDGIFGSKTDEATRDFQKKHGLTVDGIVGKFTWSAGLGTL